MNRSIAILSLLFLATFSLAVARTFAADSGTPEIGKPIPDYTFTNVLHYRSKTLSLKDCRGKWLFLDFWSPQCKACIPTFPKANGFLKEFDKQINWVMVGYNVQNAREDSKDVERIYEKFRLKEKLQMIAAVRRGYHPVKGVVVGGLNLLASLFARTQPIRPFFFHQRNPVIGGLCCLLIYEIALINLIFDR